MKSETTIAPRALTIPGVCTALGIKKTLAYALIAAGELDKCKIGGRTVVPVDSIEALIERTRSSNQTPAVAQLKPAGSRS